MKIKAFYCCWFVFILIILLPYCFCIHAAIHQPLGVHVSGVNPSQLTISWEPIASNCPTTVINYTITSSSQSECGECAVAMSQNYANCSVNPSSSGRLCAFIVQSFVCGSSSPATTDTVNTTLKGMKCTCTCNIE